MTLKDIPIGQMVTIQKINCQGAIKRRIMDMGLTKGTQIQIQKIAPLGDPIQISVRDYELSIRKADAAFIEVA